MASRKYTAQDLGACRWIYENRSVGMRAVIPALGDPLSVAMVERLCLLNLADGPITGWAIGDAVRLTGLGVKQAKEAQRLGVAAVTAAMTFNEPPPEPEVEAA